MQRLVHVLCVILQLLSYTVLPLRPFALIVRASAPVNILPFYVLCSVLLYFLVINQEVLCCCSQWNDQKKWNYNVPLTQSLALYSVIKKKTMIILFRCNFYLVINNGKTVYRNHCFDYADAVSISSVIFCYILNPSLKKSLRSF